MRSGMFAVLAYCLVGSYLLGESGSLAGLPNFGRGRFWGLRWQVIGSLADRQQWGGVPQKKGGNRKLRLAASGYLLG